MTDSSRSSDGRHSRFVAVWEECRDRVQAFFWRKRVDPDEAEDLTQTTGLRVYDGLEGYREDAKPCTWVLSIAKNVWLNRLRYHRAKKRQGIEIPLEHPRRPGNPGLERSFGESITHDETVDPLDGLLSKEKVERVRQAVEELPTKMRRIYCLHLNGLSYKQIARVAGCADGTVKSHLNQARQRLRSALRDLLDEDDQDGDGTT